MTLVSVFFWHAEASASAKKNSRFPNKAKTVSQTKEGKAAGSSSKSLQTERLHSTPETHTGAMGFTESTSSSRRYAFPAQ
ncbi:hypothetical protein ACO0LF_14700 [Undibacterium sp. Di27W]|uniref:hypothetical protein n=1 Tax=Undibacterium sp. Di27W TaxID=3413036 RepID=UPI003BF232B3